MRNISEKDRLAKNSQIRETKKATLERHSSMLCKTFDVKIQENKLSEIQKEALTRVFLEQKWFKNYILNWSNEGYTIGEKRYLGKFDIRTKTITKKNAKMEDEEITLKYLSSQEKLSLINTMSANIKTLATLKKKGNKVGRLKFSKEETAIGLIQYGISYKIVSSKRVKIQGLPKAYPVNGLKQFVNIPGLEFANARLLRRATGYYIQIVCYAPKEQKVKEKINEKLGIDFGCTTSFTLSNGEKIDAKIPESGRLKKCQRSMAKKVKGSKNWLREVHKVQKEYQKLTNRKNDAANKFVSKVSKYETIVIQDEQLSKWHKSGYGKTVQHSILGRVKSKLMTAPNVVVLGKTVPTTKLCTKCGQYHDELKVWDRAFKCDCGVEMDRDVHAAKNMVWFFENNVGVERTNLKRMEIKALVSKALSSGSEKSTCENQLKSAKYEAESL